MQNHDLFVRARVDQTHKRRLEELIRATGLSESAVIRKLIENSRLEMLPTPAATIPVRLNKESCESLS